MKLKTMLRGFSDAHLYEGAPEGMEEAHAAKVRLARVEVARRNSRWTEVDEVDLVPRGRGWLVSAETDAIYLRCRGVVFAPGSASVFADQVPLFFFVNSAHLVFLEKVTNPATWTEHLERQAAKERRRRAPKPQPRGMQRSR